MKKLFLGMAALVAMVATSCVQTEELAVANNKEAIAFDTFVENVTKTLYDNSNLTYFNVYGTITADNGGLITNIFPGVPVTNETGPWTYDSQFTQYWIPGFTYKFAAVVGAKDDKAVVGLDTNGMPATISTNLQDQEDILYKEVEKHFGTNDTAAKVSFQFAHLLSKAKFTVKNGIVNGQDFVYNIQSVKITNAYETAEYNVANKTWTGAGNREADFEVNTAVAQGANTVSKDILLVPGTKELAIEIAYNLTYKNPAGNVATLVDTTKKLTAVLTLAKGNAYNFVVEFGNPGEDIKFDAQVDEWVNGGNAYEGKTTTVSNADGLVAALNDANVTAVVLAEDIDLNATRATTIGLTINRDLILDGNGHKIVSAHDRAINVSGAENVTFKNLVIEATGERAINLIQGAKKVTIEDVTAASANYTVNVAASAPDANITISNSNLTGLNTVNIAGANAVVTINDSTIICNDQNESENYYAIAMNKDATNAVVTVNGGEIIVYGGSYAGSVSSNDASFVLNGTETHGATVREVNFAIVYGNNYNGYSTLAEAIEMVKAGETIELIRDVTVAEPITVPAGKTVVLDLNGHTISSVDTATSSYGLITNNGNLTIQGTGKLELSAENDRDWNAYSSVVSNNPGGKLTVEQGVIIEHLGGTDMAYGIDNLTNGKGTYAVTILNGATVKSTYSAVRQFLNGVEATNELYVKNGSTLVSPNSSIFFQDPSKNANTGKLVVESGASVTGDVRLSVTEGSTEWPVEVSVAKAALKNGAQVTWNTLPAGYTVLEQDGVWTVINAVPVATENALHTALASGHNVVLTEDITFETGVNGHGFSVTGAENMTIDLNGKTLTSNLGNNALSFKIGEGNNIQNTEVTITVKNGKVVSGSNNWCAVSATSVNGNKLTLNLEDIEIENNKSGDYAVKAWTGATINAKNVTVTSNAGGSFYAVGGEIVLDGCSAVTTSGSAAYMAAAIGISGNGKVTVNSGNYTATPSTAGGQWVVYLMTSGGEFVVNGGTFNGTVATNSTNHSLAYGLICADTGAKVTLNGGTYNSNGAILDIRNNEGNASKQPSALLAGGNYSADPRVSGLYGSNLITVADGKTVAQGTNGRWTVE